MLCYILIMKLNRQTDHQEHVKACGQNFIYPRSVPTVFNSLRL